MPDAERESAGEEFDCSTGWVQFDRDARFSGDPRKYHLLGRLAEQAAGLRASTAILGDHIEQLARLAIRHRLG